MERKKLSIILLIITIIFTIIGGSLAYLNWQTSTEQQTAVTFTVTSDFSCAADGGGNITSNDVALAPCECTNSTYAIKREIKVMPTITSTGKTIYMDLWLNINELGTGLSNSDNFKYALTTSADNCTEPVVSGTFKGLTAGDKVELLTSKTYSATTTDTYYLWIWLDKAETSTDTMNQTVNLSLGGMCADQLSSSSQSIVPEGMIPVTIANNGTVTTISEDDEEWYDYENKKWANAVLVNQTNRSTYLGTTGETIPESDILAYYVWIPRYKYKIWTTGTSENGEEQEIDIVFESKEEKSTGTQVGEYITHPAFTFGDEELAGIWIGKFETTGTGDSPTIKPNVSSLRSQNVSTQFQTSLKFAGGTLNNGVTTFAGSETYGLSNEVNSHMAKNTEWAAVAYLSHSQYGINSEVRINNQWDYTTGCGASTANASNSSTCDIAYGSGVTSYPQSTTGNITGVFDMSGGALEYVMGVFANSDGTLWSGNSTSLNSGFNGLLGTNGTSKTNGIAFPEEKYYNVYKASSGTTISALTACNGGYCYGHGLSEVSGWYGDYANFVSSENPWFCRGGYYSGGASAGAFGFFYYYGGVSGSGVGFRSALVI